MPKFINYLLNKLVDLIIAKMEERESAFFKQYQLPKR